jgi:hypothetical protein
LGSFKYRKPLIIALLIAGFMQYLGLIIHIHGVTV